ncbi:hypothetical protein BU23DRAFT_560496 [Bimuria novae-zelandiae CBS 107.79]|uniref:Uncharacterized protein n=1 Tax=Bimuria novae-zelandiae CBS 107.79 TaxID=1447943 RepID=A0A6A5UQY2_9PLEO|nr:hypothetical protein BU23DRAFT_560496 [Bimuria novae-zelandiae CBS 107.79]
MQNASGTSTGDIQILCQHLAYTESDEIILQAFFEPWLTIVTDPEPFLEIDSTTQVFCAYPTIPACEIISDLSREDPTRRPAAIFWSKPDSRFAGSFDEVSYPLTSGVYQGNSHVQRCEDMLQGYFEVFDGEEHLKGDSKDCTEGTSWLKGMHLWLRKG